MGCCEHRHDRKVPRHKPGFFVLVDIPPPNTRAGGPGIRLLALRSFAQPPAGRPSTHPVIPWSLTPDHRVIPVYAAPDVPDNRISAAPRVGQRKPELPIVRVGSPYAFRSLMPGWRDQSLLRQGGWPTFRRAGLDCPGRARGWRMWLIRRGRAAGTPPIPESRLPAT